MTIEGKDIVFGKVVRGKDVVLSKVDQDLTIDQDWHQIGYSVHQFLPVSTWLDFFLGFKKLFQKTLIDSGIVCDDGFLPEYYHRLIRDQYDLHLKVVNRTKLYDAHEFPIDISIVEERISEILGFKVKSIKPINQERVFHFRVIRPGATDYNPLHRDVWQDENRNAINIYVPLVGSNEKSSLMIVPGSHLWSEKKILRTESGARMNGISFNVPGMISSDQELELVRPNPEKNEVLLFSPYTLHGLSANHNEDLTRISLEMRFWAV